MGMKPRRAPPLPTSSIFADFDLAGFWKDSDYARKKYVCAPPTAAMIASVEAELGVRLPPAYVELMQSQNGGIPENQCFPTDTYVAWAEDHVAIEGIAGIGRDKTYALCGELGSKFMQTEWGYPDIGICICDTPTAGHDMIMLDYRKCGRDGEPQVVHVNQENDYKITFLAENFEAFVRGLVNESVFDTSEEDLQDDLERIETGSFSSLLSDLLKAFDGPDLGPVLRAVCKQLTLDKGYFARRGLDETPGEAQGDRPGRTRARALARLSPNAVAQGCPPRSVNRRLALSSTRPGVCACARRRACDRDLRRRS